MYCNERTVVHEDSGGVSAAFPDVCKTPPNSIPIPYPNIAKSKDTDEGSETVKADDKSIMLKTSNFKESTGDQAGTYKGVVSNKTEGKAIVMSYSFDVKVEGENVFRNGDMDAAEQRQQHAQHTSRNVGAVVAPLATEPWRPHERHC